MKLYLKIGSVLLGAIVLVLATYLFNWDIQAKFFVSRKRLENIAIHALNHPVEKFTAQRAGAFQVDTIKRLRGQRGVALFAKNVSQAIKKNTVFLFLPDGEKISLPGSKSHLAGTWFRWTIDENVVDNAEVFLAELETNPKPAKLVDPD